MEEVSAAPPARPASSASSLLLPPDFIQDPAVYLSKVAAASPSPQGLSQLAGSVAAWFQSPASAATSSQVANIYLQAAAAQLQYENTTATTASGARVEESEMLQTQQKYEIMEVRSFHFYGSSTRVTTLVIFF